MFGPFAEAAWALATSGGCHRISLLTVKSGACPTSTQNTTCYAYLNDSRSTSIAPEPGNLWVVWNSTGIWAYLSVDSTVGVRRSRQFLAQPWLLICQPPAVGL